MLEGAMSWALGPTVPPVVPSRSSTVSPLDNMYDLLMTGSAAARLPPCPGLPVTQGLSGLGPIAESSALPPSLPTLSEHVTEVKCCPEKRCTMLAQRHNQHCARSGHGWQAYSVLKESTSVLRQMCVWQMCMAPRCPFQPCFLLVPH